jgi:hypothetical protein
MPETPRERQKVVHYAFIAAAAMNEIELAAPKLVGYRNYATLIFLLIAQLRPFYSAILCQCFYFGIIPDWESGPLSNKFDQKEIGLRSMGKGWGSYHFYRRLRL